MGFRKHGSRVMISEDPILTRLRIGWFLWQCVYDGGRRTGFEKEAEVVRDQGGGSKGEVRGQGKQGEGCQL